MRINNAGSAEALREKVEDQTRRCFKNGLLGPQDLQERIAHLDNIADLSQNRNRQSQVRIAAVRTGLLMGVITREPDVR